LTVLHAFNGFDGWGPCGILQARDGCFYGTAALGGPAFSPHVSNNGNGTVFRLAARGQFAVLDHFRGDNGSRPLASLLQARDGRLYGTTFDGGATGGGTAFRLTATGALETIVHFRLPYHSSPYGGLVEGDDGHFYGVTYLGGSAGVGTVFRMTADGALTPLASLGRSSGGLCASRLLQTRDRSFCGTAIALGGSNHGTVFRVTPQGRLTTLAEFRNANGAYPQGGLIQARDGHFYGTTNHGGDCRCPGGCGTVFRLGADGVLATLARFDGSNGANPCAGLLQASDGNFYGTTQFGGAWHQGTAFRLTPDGELTTLVDFGCMGGGGIVPNSTLVEGADGNLYGTTEGGGIHGCGTVFRLSSFYGPLLR
jgi:uncharacterized repeat protein (TIGR03803 family)